MGAAERQAEALRLRRDGLSYSEIATRLGYADKATAYNAIRAALKEITREPAEEVKKLELERLDKLFAESMAIVESAPVKEVDDDGNLDLDAFDESQRVRLDAIRTALKVSERRSKLEGLDAPVKTQEVPVDKLAASDIEKELRAELEAVEAMKKAGE